MFVPRHTEPAGQTPCQRRTEMTSQLLSDPTKLNLFLHRARRTSGNAVIKFTFPECLADGNFAPTQCNENVDTRQKTDCFCVDRKGKPLGGTSVPPDQTPECAREWQTFGF